MSEWSDDAVKAADADLRAYGYPCSLPAVHSALTAADAVREREREREAVETLNAIDGLERRIAVIGNNTSRAHQCIIALDRRLTALEAARQAETQAGVAQEPMEAIQAARREAHEKTSTLRRVMDRSQPAPDRRCGTCRFRGAGADIKRLCQWEPSEGWPVGVSSYPHRARMAEDDGTDCPTWEPRDDR